MSARNKAGIEEVRNQQLVKRTKTESCGEKYVKRCIWKIIDLEILRWFSSDKGVLFMILIIPAI